MSRRRWWLVAGSLVALTLAASANGILNDFTYDDRYIILLNAHVRSLHGWWRIFSSSYWPEDWGGDGYRPLSTLLFALEWFAGRGAPWLFHAVNIVLYCATTLAVFWLASMLMPEAGAWVAAALFAVHPVHVESVANVVGQEELSVALTVILAVAIYIRARRGGELRPSTMCSIGLLYVAGCLFKEHAIVLPAVLVATEATVVPDERPLGRRLFVSLRPFWLLLAMLGLAYLFVRSRVLVDDLAGFKPFIVFETLNLSYANRVLTMLGVVPQWLRLLLWPAHLSSEYAPPYIDIAQGPELSQLPGLLLLLGVLGIAVASWKRQPRITFAIAWVVIILLPSSNFILPAGIILAERTLFLPSVGAMLLVGMAVPWVQQRLARQSAKMAAAGTLACLLGLGAWRSFDRTTVWHDNDRLFRQAVKDSPLMYRAHYMLGAWLFQKKRKREGEVAYRRALHLFPYDPFMSFNLAEQYRLAGMCPFALPLYKWSYEVSNKFHEGHVAYAWCLLVTQHFDDAKREAYYGLSEGTSKYKDAKGILASADSAIRNTGRHGPPPDSLTNAVVRQAGKVP